jgi:hypothetical protein
MGRQPCRNPDQPAPEGFDHGLTHTNTQPDSRPCGPSVAVSWCNQPAMVAANNAPHVHAVFTSQYPPGRCRRAAPCLLSPKAFSMLVRCRYQYSTAAAVPGWVMSSRTRRTRRISRNVFDRPPSDQPPLYSAIRSSRCANAVSSPPHARATARPAPPANRNPTLEDHLKVAAQGGGRLRQRPSPDTQITAE